MCNIYSPSLTSDRIVGRLLSTKTGQRIRKQELKIEHILLGQNVASRLSERMKASWRLCRNLSEQGMTNGLSHCSSQRITHEIAGLKFTIRKYNKISSATVDGRDVSLAACRILTEIFIRILSGGVYRHFLPHVNFCFSIIHSSQLDEYHSKT